MTYRHAVLAIGALALCAAFNADAARLGGGRSFGAQRPMLTTPRAAAPAAPAATNSFAGPAANPVMPRTAATAGAPTAAAAATAAAPRPAGSRWLAPLAGIAAGIGLAALMSHFGMSSAFSGVLLVLLVVVGGALLARMFLTRRLAVPGGAPIAAANDPVAAFEPRFGGAVQPASAPQAAANPSHWPSGFDSERFARQALQQFRAVQRAYDNGDTAALADVMTPELYTETVSELRSRGL
ncbi:MAG: TIM44-like domain-containing protein, partial [Casimicrobiaceae bacterium]